ncbi:MAG: RHS repeat protein [Lachnospiraceae bacterium]|nr:RHS repeat protein [Lachnospiraceae bacterium]
MRFFVRFFIAVLIFVIVNPVIVNAGKETIYNYSSSGKLESVVYPNGTKIIYIYDKSGNVEEVQFVEKKTKEDNNSSKKPETNDKKVSANEKITNDNTESNTIVTTVETNNQENELHPTTDIIFDIKKIHPTIKSLKSNTKKG